MKKYLLTVVVALFAAGYSFGQYALDKGKAQINAGLGFSSRGVPIYAGFDVGVHRDISVGGDLSFRTYKNNYVGYRYKHNIIGIAGNANYHFNTLLQIPKEFDFYAGLSLGYYIWSTSDSSYTGSGDSGLGLGVQVGGRYYFNNKFGVNVEFGGANTFSGGKVGISIKL